MQPTTNGSGSASGSTYLDPKSAKDVLNEYKRLDGLSLKELMDSSKHGGLTYNDLIVLPGHIDFSASAVSTETRITRNVSLKTPFLSSPMDTVTETETAIAMALLGGIGVIHHNMSASLQAEMVRKVKKYENGFITDPVCLKPDDTVAEVLEIKELYGYSGIPITDTGKLGGKLLGIVTARDVQFRSSETSVSSVMTKHPDLVVASQGITLEEANTVLRDSKKGKLPLATAKAASLPSSLVPTSSRTRTTRSHPKCQRQSSSSALRPSGRASTTASASPCSSRLDWTLSFSTRPRATRRIRLR